MRNGIGIFRISALWRVIIRNEGSGQFGGVFRSGAKAHLFSAICGMTEVMHCYKALSFFRSL